MESDGRNCVDINECEDGTHNCDTLYEECINNPGGFQCLPKHEEENKDLNLCPEGYKWNMRDKRCSG